MCPEHNPPCKSDSLVILPSSKSGLMDCRVKAVEVEIADNKRYTDLLKLLDTSFICKLGIVYRSWRNSFEYPVSM